ncbi:MAG: ATP-dependent Clp protease proteolytic subunit [Rhodobacteraceae bacterium]|nr:ATP-dependent Clp protease proteolytic subunit [Paracoccaceae bacterium]
MRYLAQPDLCKAFGQMSDDKDTDQKEAFSPERITFENRYVTVVGEINDKLAKTTVERLLALAAVSDDPITMFISSPGGHVESGDMVHDLIKFIKPTVRVIGSGWVASAGALIFIGAKKENRFCLPNTRFLLHQPSGGIGGKASDIQIQAQQLKIMKERFERIFAEATGQSEEKIAEDTKRDFWLNTDEAIAYGLLGKVITSASDI